MTKDELRTRYKEIDCAIDVKDGWLSLVNELCGALEATGIAFKISCIKEKFGGLRCYVDFEGSASDADYNKAWDIIAQYEDKSLSVCQECSKPGLLRESGWIRTLCKDHSEGYKPSLFKATMDHKCRSAWNTCPECNLPSCTACSVACFQCVDAWRHKACGQKHADATKHWGHVNDLEYLVASIGTVGKAANILHGDHLA